MYSIRNKLKLNSDYIEVNTAIKCVNFRRCDDCQANLGPTIHGLRCLHTHGRFNESRTAVHFKYVSTPTGCVQ